ncbi:5-carboxymethyl-2-hydroxymuconate Delta-isomerase [Flavobacterium sp.]|jgi:5-carboxymethyl-2-hydroxymuconate isomerase|uniref:5-carboxymethyl-2-hydroxymuconate Delta-isomerase n=1 Tax=Flavobacterium sp. TaxID=239 RepID=UPI0037C18B07
MPHCVIEYSQDLQIHFNQSNFSNMISKKLIDSDLFDPNTIKIRAMKYDDYLVANTSKPFIAISVKLMPGRSKFQLESLATKILKCLESKFDFFVEITIEFIEINPQFYFKNS